MEKIAIISDVHANITALNAVLKDISDRNIKRIFCLGDSVGKGVNPALVFDKLKEICEVILIGNVDYILCRPEAKHKNFWSRVKIGEERANYVFNLPKSFEFYMSGHLIRLFHASPHNLDGIYNPLLSDESPSSEINLEVPELLFENTNFIGKTQNDPIPDIVGYGHLHTPFIVRHKNKTIFNVGSVGASVEMLNSSVDDNSNKFSTLASYMVLEGNYDCKDLGSISFNLIRVPYDIEKEIANLEASDIPRKDLTIRSLKGALPTSYTEF